MKYSINQLLQTDKTFQYIFFWGQQTTKNNGISKACLSQWWASSFTAEGKHFHTAEHWMMYKKAELFGDEKAANSILENVDPKVAKRLGRNVKYYNDVVWLEQRYEIVKQGNLHKFSQNTGLGEFLLSTQDAILVEASPFDSIWGIGLRDDHPEIENPASWKGLNLLGFVLMEVRDILKTLHNLN